MRNLLLPLFLIVALVSCQSNDVVNIDLDSTLKTYVRGKVLSELELYNPRNISQINDTILLFDKASDDGFIWFVNTENGKLIRRYGIQGRGPNEYLNPNIFKYDNSILIQTIDGKTYLLDTKCEPEEILTNDKSAIRVGCNYLGVFSDGTFVVSSPSTEDRLNFINLSEQKEYNRYPFKVSKKLQMLKETVFDATYDVSEQQRSVIIVNRYYPIIEVINKETFETKVFKIIDHGESNSFQIQNGVAYFNEPILKYTECLAGKNGIYALYHNAREEDAISTLPEIHLISYDGQLLRRLALDHIIYDFTISDDENSIYALGLNSDFLPEIITYDLSDEVNVQ